MHRAIGAHEGTLQTVVIFNPLEQITNEVVMVVVERSDATVLDSNWTCVKSQISPELCHDTDRIFTGRHRLYWKASVPAMGLQTYYIANGFVGCEKAKPARVRIFTSSKQLSCPTSYACSDLESDTVEISNQHQTLIFNVSCGQLQKISREDGHITVIEEELGMYSSTGSGAYLFKPNGNAEPIGLTGGQIVVAEGHLVREVFSNPRTSWEKTPVSHSTRVYNCESSIQEFVVEKEYHVELIGHDFNDKELIARYKTNVDNNRIFYSDLNGFQMSRRETYDKIPLQGNYYPMPSLAFMVGSNGERFSVHTRQSLGVASLENGWLEIMLDRRLVRDDDRGLGQGVMDNRPMIILFHILLESNVSSSANPTLNPRPLSPSLLSHLVGAHLNYPLQIFIAKKAEAISAQPPPRSFSPLVASLPCDLHIVNFKVPRPSKYSQQPLEEPKFVLVLQRRHWDSSYCRKGRSQCSSIADEPINLFDMFSGLTVSNAKATSLNLLHEDTDILGYSEQFGSGAQEGHVIISPMEIQAYKLHLRSQQ